MQSCRVVVNPSGLWSPGQRFESAQDYKIIFNSIINTIFFKLLFTLIVLWEASNSQNFSCSIFALEDDDARLSYMLEGPNDYSLVKTGKKKKAKKAGKSSKR